MSSSSGKKPVTVPSNLQSFLHSITPTVPSKTLPKSCMEDINSLWYPINNKDTIEYFTLGDLWEFYDEWSAYGVGSPVVLNDGDTVVQYYVPFLSAIQIYTNKTSPASRNAREDNDVGECEGEFWSDDSESDKLSRSLSNNSSKGWDATSLDSSDASSPMRDRLGQLYFQYYETCSPYWRIPLADRITEFSRTYPGLGTLKSVDLSPASWMAVAWYPIYHIPTKGNVKELSTCFLTFHTLSSSFQDTTVDDDSDIGKNIPCSEVVDEILRGKSKTKGSDEISLPPFGLATYKMQGNLWVNQDVSDRERLVYLHSAADSWLKQLNVQHHDFSFYTNHTTINSGSSIDTAGMPL